MKIHWQKELPNQDWSAPRTEKEVPTMCGIKVDFMDARWNKQLTDCGNCKRTKNGFEM